MVTDHGERVEFSGSELYFAIAAVILAVLLVAPQFYAIFNAYRIKKHD